MANELTWHDVLAEEKQQPYFLNTLQTVASERQSGVTIYPPQKDVFNAFRFTELGDVKVVILGQDPYHGPGQAHGLAFSVRPGIATPPSLLNMYKELEATIPGFTRPTHGYLESWARQGVLLLNTVLTVRAGQANSHKNLGWTTFTDHVIEKLNDHEKPIVFLLWGGNARSKARLITAPQHLVLEAAHPSPLSAYNGFFGCHHFSMCNDYLKSCGLTPIDWDLNTP